MDGCVYEKMGNAVDVRDFNSQNILFDGQGKSFRILPTTHVFVYIFSQKTNPAVG